MTVEEMTHDDIADFGAERIRKMGYTFSCSNMTSSNHKEQPDVLALNNSGESVLMEIKTSRADFFADQKKPFRINPKKGIGDFRIYLTPKGLLKPEEVPYGWMLWEIHGKNKPILKVIKGKAKTIVKKAYGTETKWDYVNCDVNEYLNFKKTIRKNYKKELTWMMKIMTRAMKAGFEPNDFANNYQNKKRP